MSDKNASGGNRKCWQTARERNRLRARFEIKCRVERGFIVGADGQQEHQTTTSESDLNKEGNEKDAVTARVLSQEEAIIFSKTLQAIRRGDRSKFSLNKLNQYVNWIGSPISICQLSEQTLTETYELAVSAFGVEYFKSLKEYLDSLGAFTLLEYAVWMGKYSIVTQLLVGGINPCVRGWHSQDKNEPDSLLHSWHPVLEHVGAQILQLFFGFFPQRLSTYIVKRVVECRMAAGLKRSDQEDVALRCCQRCQREDMNRSTLIAMECGHTICELCLWEDILHHVDGRGERYDVVVCPYCGKSSTNAREQIDDEFNSLSPDQRKEMSLRRLKELPATQLRYHKKQRRKPQESDFVAPSFQTALSHKLGTSQYIRRDKFFSYVDRNAVHFVNACLRAGVDLNWQNEYGQTALYIAVWRGYDKLVMVLIASGADVTIPSNGGSSICDILQSDQSEESTCSKMIHSACLQQSEPSRSLVSSFHRFPSIVSTEPKGAILIPPFVDHPGAGSYVVDDAFGDKQIEVLLRLHSTIPTEKPNARKSAKPCSRRSYYCDADGSIGLGLIECIAATKEVSHHGLIRRVFPHMRFLHYDESGAELAPHVDLIKSDAITGERSTHTFILYLTDCCSGGETTLLGSLLGVGKKEVLASVRPQRGRLLLFPHACPHAGDAVIDVPKTLLRGEILLC